MTDPTVASAIHALLGTSPTFPKPSTPAFTGPQSITVVAGGTPDGIRFTVDSYSTDLAMGPVPFPRPAKGMVPPAGTKGTAHLASDGVTWHLVSLFGWP